MYETEPETLTILSIGETPLCSFLPWRLSTVQCPVTMVYSQFNKNGQIMWSSSKYGSHLFTPTTPINSVSGMAARLSRSVPIDVVLLGANSHKDLKQAAQTIQKYIVPDETLVLVDSSFSIGLERLVCSALEYKCTVLSVFSAVNIKQQNNCHFQIGGDVGIQIGLSRLPGTKKADRLHVECLNLKNSAGIKLQRLCQLAAAAEISPASVNAFNVVPTYSALLWKHIAEFVCIHVLHILYEDALFEQNSPIMAPVLKSVYRDMCTLGKKLGFDVEKMKLDLATLLIRDKARYHDKEPLNGPSVSEFNFHRGKETFVKFSLLQLLILADELQCEGLVALECSLAAYDRISALTKQQVKTRKATVSRPKSAQTTKPTKPVKSLSDRVDSILGPNKYRC